MTEVLLDPEDPTQGFIASSTDAVLGAAMGDALLVNIHPAWRCAGRPCVIHAPTEHHMRTWLLHWRDDRTIFERMCPHLVGHPDPDQITFWRETGQEEQAVHGCDGCCGDPKAGWPT